VKKDWEAETAVSEKTVVISVCLAVRALPSSREVHDRHGMKGQEAL